MPAQPGSTPERKARIGRQVVLPWSKAIEIAVKSIQVRFWRSLITMGSIVLAIAFLMSIWTSTAIVASLNSGPARELSELDSRIEAFRSSQTEVARSEALSSSTDLLPRATRALRRQLRATEDSLTNATGEAKQKLGAEVVRLEALLDPDKRYELILYYLNDLRSGLQEEKGRLDALVSQERGAEAPPMGDEAHGVPAEPVADAEATGGLVTDFLRQMTPTDKWLAILALLVCFVGIVNAMFMTVQERFREIGTMKCLGALDSFIVKLFLLESAALGLIGTLAGIVLGLLLSLVRQLFVYGWAVLKYFPFGNLLLAAALATLVGLLLSVLAAIFPARKAAQMEPVEAMRIEE